MPAVVARALLARVAVGKRARRDRRGRPSTHSSSVQSRLPEALHARSAWSREMYPCGDDARLRHRADRRRPRRATGTARTAARRRRSARRARPPSGRCRSGPARAPSRPGRALLRRAVGSAAVQAERDGAASWRRQRRRQSDCDIGAEEPPARIARRHGCGMRCVNHAAAPAAIDDDAGPPDADLRARAAPSSSPASSDGGRHGQRPARAAPELGAGDGAGRRRRAAPPSRPAWRRRRGATARPPRARRGCPRSGPGAATPAARHRPASSRRRSRRSTTRRPRSRRPRAAGRPSTQRRRA